MTKPKVSTAQIRKAALGRVSTPLARTLSECLFWSQHATHMHEDRPSIYKTGKEVGGELGIAARTVNTHFKKLAELGYWTIRYEPRPGHPSPVTWLDIADKSLELIELARTIDLSRNGGASRKRTSNGGSMVPSGVSDNDTQTSQNTTSIQPIPTAKTAAGVQSFLPSKDQAKAGMKEPCSLSQEKQGKVVQAPKYVNATEIELAFGRSVEEQWSERKIPSWDWSSKYTWDHIREIVGKLAAVGRLAEVDTLLAQMLDEWHWLRTTMAYRYASHGSNLHAPSPMALAHEIDELISRIDGKFKPPEELPNSTCFDQEF